MSCFNTMYQLLKDEQYLKVYEKDILDTKVLIINSNNSEAKEKLFKHLEFLNANISQLKDDIAEAKAELGIN